MKRTVPVLFAALVSASAIAQTWTVGVPAAYKWSQATYYGQSCSPGADQNIYFTAPNVSGVQYVAIVDAVSPAATNLVSPGGTAPLNVGDTVPLVSGAPNSVFFPSGSGNMTLSFWAIGTPTTAGQSYPCSFSDFWISNMMFCPEGLSLTVPASCTVQQGTAGVSAVAASGPSISFPSAANGWTISISASSYTSAKVLDITGRTIARKFPANLSGFPDGIYLVQATRPDGTASTHRFVLSR